MKEGGRLISKNQLISLQGLDIDKNSGDKLFGRWSFVHPSVFLMIQDQHQSVSRQDRNIFIVCGDELVIFSTNCFTKKFLDVWFLTNISLWLQGVNTDTSGGDKLFPQQSAL